MELLMWESKSPTEKVCWASQEEKYKETKGMEGGMLRLGLNTAKTEDYKG